MFGACASLWDSPRRFQDFAPWGDCLDLETTILLRIDMPVPLLASNKDATYLHCLAVVITQAKPLL